MILNQTERRAVQALGQVLFLRDRTLDIDESDAGVTDYVDDYVERLPWFERQQMRALIRAFDVGFGVQSFRPTRRFSDATFDERRDYIDSWQRSSLYTRRMAYEGLRMILTMAYVESDVVKEAVGISYGSAGLSACEEST